MTADESIRQKLNDPGNFNYEATPWREIEEELEKTYGFNIVLTSSARDDSLTEEEPVTEFLTGIPLRSALLIMLQKKNATFLVQDGVMKIISLDDADDAERFATVFVNVRSLLESISIHEKARLGTPRITTGKNTTETEGRAVELVTAETLLTDLIHSAYQTDQWQSTGQGLATINIVGGVAVIKGNEEFANGLRSFLADLDYHLSQD